MSEGFWSLRNAPKWWFNKNSLWVLAGVIVVTVAWKVAYGPSRVPAGKVVFYSATYCPYSDALRNHLRASNIPYEERGVEESFGNVLRYMAASGRGGRLPLVQVGPRVVAKGFQRREIDLALREAGFKPADGPSGPEGGSERR